MTTAPTTELGRTARVHVIYRRMAHSLVSQGGQITPDTKLRLTTHAESRVPAVCAVSKPSKVYSYFHPYMALEASKTGAVNFPSNPMPVFIDAPQSPQIEAVLEETVIKPELIDSTAQPLRDLREIQVPVEALAAGDVIALPSPPVPGAPKVHWLIHSITPYVKGQPRQAVVVKFMGKVTPDGIRWALSGSECVPFETVTTMRYWTVCGGAKLEAARNDASRVVKVATMQRWIGEKVA